MKTLNIIGRIVKDPTVRDAGGHKVCEVNVACDGEKDKNGERDTWFVRLSFWDKQGDVWMNYKKKGDYISAIIEPTIRTYAKNDGTQGMSIEARRVIAAYPFDIATGRTTAGGEKPATTTKANYSAPTKADYVEVDELDDMPF